jgi:Grx4 family monothiol glutaredoxin
MSIVVDFTEVPPTGKKTVLLFWAPWHEASVEGGPMDQVLRALAASSSTSVSQPAPPGKNDAPICFGRVQAEEVPSLTEKYQVTVVPTFVLIDATGTVVERIEGGEDDVSQVTTAVQRLAQREANHHQGSSVMLTADSSSSSLATPMTPPLSSLVSPEEQLKQRLDRLIRSSEVMLFIKGTPEAAKCGFSRQIVEMLQEEAIPFGSFDILSDEQVRQGLKTHSNWPTYPQVYVNGDLVGGLDILKEMKSEGSLKEQFGITATVSSPASLEERLSQLVRRHRVMLFMKGLPSAPQCGFSRQIVQLLDGEGISYDAFDILQDEEVRQGLKKFSNWPTFPQLYVNGDLIGGLDIVQEMKEDGSLDEVLKG